MAEGLGVAASVIAVVDLSTKVISLCSQYYRDVKNARNDITRLEREISNLKHASKGVQQLLDHHKGAKLEASQKLRDALTDGSSQLEKLEQQLSSKSIRKAMSRVGIRALKWPFESKDVEKIIQDLGRCTQIISLGLQVDQTAILLQVDQNLVDADRKTVLDKLPIAKGAAFDSYAEQHNPTCHPDTRIELLRDIFDWAVNPEAEAIFWLNGMAGTGKSTISRTVARAFAETDHLGASFFFKRGEGDRGTMAAFFTTIAAQLARKKPACTSHIKNAIDADPNIVGKTMREQFEKLILEPLSRISPSAREFSPVVIIVDALDECEREADVKLMISLFSRAKTLQHLRLRIFVTSRPELPIRLGFRAIKGTYQDLVLHEIPEPVVEHDISAFLRHELAEIRDNYNGSVSENRQLPRTWPDQSDIKILAEMAIPLFIFAATVCRFIADRRCGNPDKQLREVLDYRTKSQESQLDATYLPVLNQLLVGLSTKKKNEVLEQFQGVVGSIIMLASPLSTCALARLLADWSQYLQTLEGHNGWVNSVTFSHDSVFVASASNDGTVRLWRTDTGDCVQILKGHNDWVNSVTFSHDSVFVASASTDYTVRLWRTDTGDCVQIFEGHSESVNSVAFSHNSAFITSASNDRTVRLWRADTGDCIQIFKGHSNWVFSVAFSHDSAFIASASVDNTVRL
ncbi:hypothetical protein DL771_009584 [Monosporascus sp. 5C6A]|nr:hypothetical protein DL771_009584 [Monosporascus sp. 5C6A]